MQLKLIAQTLDDVRQEKEGEEFWSARDIWGLLGYSSWRNFEPAVERAIESCKKSGSDVEYHFAGARKMVDLGSGSQRGLPDYKLTRYACYLIAQNGDPRIPEIALAQMYFAMQTRRQEVLEKHIEEIERLISRNQLGETDKEFSKTIYERGVDGRGIAEIKSLGDQALFGGVGTKQMKRRLKVNPKKPLADFLQTVVLKAKDLATEMTTVNTKRKDLRGKVPIKREHTSNNSSVRRALVDTGIKPEDLPAAEDTKKVESRHRRIKREIEAPKPKQLPN